MGKLEDAVKKLQKRMPSKARFVDVGVFDAEVASYAAIHEYGSVQTVTPKQSLYLKAQLGLNPQFGGAGPNPGATLVTPARPVFGATFRAKNKDWTDKVQRVLKYFGTDEAAVDKSLRMVGQIAAEDLKETITNGGTKEERFAPRSEMTKAIYANQSKGKKKDGTGNVNSETPLRLSGQYLNSISFEMR